MDVLPSASCKPMLSAGMAIGVAYRRSSTLLPAVPFSAMVARGAATAVTLTCCAAMPAKVMGSPYCQLSRA